MRRRLAPRSIGHEMRRRYRPSQAGGDGGGGGGSGAGGGGDAIRRQPSVSAGSGGIRQMHNLLTLPLQVYFRRRPRMRRNLTNLSRSVPYQSIIPGSNPGSQLCETYARAITAQTSMLELTIVLDPVFGVSESRETFSFH